MMKSKNIICLSVTIKLLRIYYVFPPQNNVFNPGLIYYGKFAVLALIPSITLMGSVLHLMMAYKDPHYGHILVDINNIISIGSALILITSFMYKVTSAAHIFAFLSDFDEYGKPADFDKKNKLLDRLSTIQYIYLEVLMVVITLLSDIFKTESCELANNKYDLREMCGLFTYIWLPFDITHYPMKQIFLVIQMFGIHYIYNVAGLLAWLVLEMEEHIAIRFRHVKHSFLESLKGKNAKTRRELFNNAVRYHNALLSLEDKLNDTFSVFMFIHMILTALILGTGINSRSQALSFSASNIICIGWFCGLMMDSFSGQYLQDESLDVGTALYNANWYDCECDLQKDIMFVIMRCQIPIKLKAAAFGIMDQRMFLTVLKATYSYITILSQRK